MKKTIFLGFLLIAAIPSLIADEVAPPPLAADEESYSFTCEELYLRGRKDAPTWSKGWFGAGIGIGFASILLGFGASIESESESLVGVAVGAGIGLGVSIVLPLMFTQRKSFNLFENPEANECYNNGYYRKTRATNTTASIVGDILGVPAAPFLVILALFEEYSGCSF